MDLESELWYATPSSFLDCPFLPKGRDSQELRVREEGKVRRSLASLSFTFLAFLSWWFHGREASFLSFLWKCSNRRLTTHVFTLNQNHQEDLKVLNKNQRIICKRRNVFFVLSECLEKRKIFIIRQIRCSTSSTFVHFISSHSIKSCVYKLYNHDIQQIEWKRRTKIWEEIFV